MSAEAGETPNFAMPMAAGLDTDAGRTAFFDPTLTPHALETVAQFHGYDLADPAQAGNAQTVFDLLQTDNVLWGHYLRMMNLQAEHSQLSAERRINAKTGLPNAVAFWEDFPHLVEEADSNQSGIALIFGDINGFKGINDEYGYAAGDTLIKQAMAKLERSLRGNVLIYHISGDECVVVVSDLPNVDDDIKVLTQPTGRHSVDDIPELRGVDGHTNPQRVAAIRGRMRKKLLEEVFVGQFAGHDLDLATGVAISAGSHRKSATELFIEANDDMHRDKDEIKDLLWKGKPWLQRLYRSLGEYFLRKANVSYDRR